LNYVVRESGDNDSCYSCHVLILSAFHIAVKIISIVSPDYSPDFPDFGRHYTL
jgi:hypothetical protein